MLLDNSRSSWIAPPDGLEQKSAGAEDGSVSHLAWATITQYHKLGTYTNRLLLSPSSGGWKSEVKMSAGPCPP